MNAVVQLKPRINLGLQKKVEQYQDKLRDIKKLSEERDVLKKELMAAMAETGQILNAKQQKIAWVTESHPEQFNKTQFKKDHYELYEQYKYLGNRTTLYTA